MSTMYEIVNPAELVDLADCARPGPRLNWLMLKRQLRIGHSQALRADGVAYAVMGLIPHGSEAEAWFLASPRASQHMLAVVRTVRLTLRTLPYDPVYSVIWTDAGRRLAHLAGFTPDETVNDMEIFRWVGSRNCSAAAEI